jgi:hypothetical protein
MCRSLLMLTCCIIVAHSALYAAKTIGVRKLALITLTIVTNALAIVGFCLFLAGLLMASTSAFHGAVDLTVGVSVWSLVDMLLSVVVS